MKNTLPLLCCLYVFALMSACSEKQVTNVAGYGKFIQPNIKNSLLEKIQAGIRLQQEQLNKDPNDTSALSHLATLLADRYTYSGNTADLYASDSLYKRVNAYIRSAATFRALAANSLTQHRFQQAQSYIDSALVFGDDRQFTALQEFDVAMELGNYPRAKQALKNISNKKSFDYLIRQSKYKDQVDGDFDMAIELMEQAFASMEAHASSSILGDMYAHANRFEEAYNIYLDALIKDPHDYHALKGIAWLAYSHDKDLVNAKKIINYLKQQHPIPDYDLLLAEIAEYEKDANAQQLHRDKFIAAVKNGMYGDMYNKYLFNLQAGELNNADKAFAIAQQEVKNRPSPEIFGWLAWAYCKKGDMANALQTSGWYVESKCYEPGILYYVGMIYHSNGNKMMARKYLQEASLGSFELGPTASAQIQEILANL